MLDRFETAECRAEAAQRADCLGQPEVERAGGGERGKRVVGVVQTGNRDADFEALAPSVEHAVITGLRGRDLALRFKYAGLAKERMEVVDEWSAAIDRATTLAPQGGEVVVLATYTAMQALRAVLHRAGAAVPFWDD